jgi:uncharacterized membrane protein YbhN (UPF0104 family)
VNKRTILNVCKYLLAFGLLGWVISENWAPPSGFAVNGSFNPDFAPRGTGLKDVWERHVVQGQPIHAGFLLGAVLCFIPALVLTLLRWYVLVRAQDLPFRVREAIRLGLVGFFFSSFLPGSVGGDLVKAAVLARQQSRRTVAVATVIMDRLIAFWGLFWFMALVGGVLWAAGALEGPGGERCQLIVRLAAAVVAASVVGWLLLGLLPDRRANRFAGRLERLPKVGGSAAEFWRAVWMYRCRQRSVAFVLAISFVGFFGFVGAFYCSARALWDGNPEAPIPTLAEHFLIVPLGLILAAIPLFPGGIGISEAGFGGLYSWLHCDRAYGVLGSLVQRVITWVLGLVGYGVALRMRSAPPGEDQAAGPEAPPALRSNGDGRKGPREETITASQER